MWKPEAGTENHEGMQQASPCSNLVTATKQMSRALGQHSYYWCAKRIMRIHVANVGLRTNPWKSSVQMRQRSVESHKFHSAVVVRATLV